MRQGTLVPLVIIEHRMMIRDFYRNFLKQQFGEIEIIEANTVEHACSDELDAGRGDLFILNHFGQGTQGSKTLVAGLGLLAQCFPAIPVVVVSDIETPEFIFEILRGGAKGFIPTSLRSELLIHALRMILAGGEFISFAALSGRNGPQAAHEDDDGRESGNGPSGFTPRQQEVLDLLLQGHSNKQIANALAMKESTVKVHVRQIMKRFNASNRTQVVVALRKMTDGQGVPLS